MYYFLTIDLVLMKHIVGFVTVEQAYRSESYGKKQKQGLWDLFRRANRCNVVQKKKKKKKISKLCRCNLITLHCLTETLPFSEASVACIKYAQDLLVTFYWSFV